MTKSLVPTGTWGSAPAAPPGHLLAIKGALKLDGRGGFVTGDIGCYAIGLGPSGSSS